MRSEKIGGCGPLLADLQRRKEAREVSTAIRAARELVSHGVNVDEEDDMAQPSMPFENQKKAKYIYDEQNHQYQLDFIMLSITHNSCNATQKP